MLVHRRPEFRAAHATVEKLRHLQEEGRADILIGNVQAFDRTHGKLVGVRVLSS